MNEVELARWRLLSMLPLQGQHLVAEALSTFEVAVRAEQDVHWREQERKANVGRDVVVTKLRSMAARQPNWQAYIWADLRWVIKELTGSSR